MEKIKNLLQQVSIIQEKYDEIAKITGENFNIFSIIKMDSNEVRMHSGFIGELLNPKGSHGLKEQPLKTFIDLLNSKFNKTDIKEDETKFFIDKFILNTESAITTVEKYIGLTNEDKIEGGRIDIIIEDKNKNAIIIENKIYAIEQTNQLIRYHKYSPKSPILYLTLYGDAPTSAEGLEKNNHYFNISYKDDIKKWLELCLKEAVEYPMLREVIKQYIYLIKKLTQQSINNNMSKDIVERMEKEIQASFEITENIDGLKYKLFENLIGEFKKSDVLNEVEEMKDDLEYRGIWLKPAIIDRKIGLFLWKHNDKNFFGDVFVGFRTNTSTEEIITKYKTDKTFEITESWVFKRPTNSWPDVKETWIDLARPLIKSKKEEASIRCTEIIEIINKIISIENP